MIRIPISSPTLRGAVVISLRSPADRAPRDVQADISTGDAALDVSDDAVLERLLATVAAEGRLLVTIPAADWPPHSQIDLAGGARTVRFLCESCSLDLPPVSPGDV